MGLQLGEGQALPNLQSMGLSCEWFVWGHGFCCYTLGGGGAHALGSLWGRAGCCCDLGQGLRQALPGGDLGWAWVSWGLSLFQAGGAAELGPTLAPSSRPSWAVW